MGERPRRRAVRADGDERHGGRNGCGLSEQAGAYRTARNGAGDQRAVAPVRRGRDGVDGDEPVLERDAACPRETREYGPPEPANAASENTPAPSEYRPRRARRNASATSPVGSTTS